MRSPKPLPLVDTNLHALPELQGRPFLKRDLDQKDTGVLGLAGILGLEPAPDHRIRNLFDLALPELPVVSLRGDADLVVEPDATRVELVELGFDPRLREIRYGHDLLSGLQTFAGVGVPRQYDSVDRRDDARLGENRGQPVHRGLPCRA